MKPNRILVRPSGATGTPSTPIRIPGEVVEGKISGFDGDDVLVDVEGGGKAVIPRTDFKSLPTVGDAISGTYLIDDRALGAAILTCQVPETEVAAGGVRPGMFVKGAVVEAGKPGLRIRVGETLGFIPASQLPAGVLREPGKLLRQDVAAVVVDVRKGEMSLSLRTVLDRRKQRQEQQRLASFHEGQRLSGTIVRKTDFGFFVDIGGVDGLLHISRLERHNEQRKGHGEEPVALEVQQSVEVVISRIDPDRQRIGLDLPDPQDPSAGYAPTQDSASADEVTGILRDLSSEGANVFVVDEGIEGFVSSARFGGQSPRPGELRRFRTAARDAVTGRPEPSRSLRAAAEEDDAF